MSDSVGSDSEPDAMLVSASKRRVKIKPRHPINLLFAQWLEEWKQEADSKDLQAKFSYSRALASLKKYPLALNSGKEAKILQNVGDKICQMLEKRLEEYRAEIGEPTLEDILSPSDCSQNSKRLRRKSPGSSGKKSYIPAPGSSVYALLVALYHSHMNSSGVEEMSKSELIDAAQPLANTSLTKPAHGSYYCGWSSMSTLTGKGLVLRQGNPVHFSLTSAGIDLAEKLLNAKPEPDTQLVDDNKLAKLQGSHIKPKKNKNKAMTVLRKGKPATNKHDDDFSAALVHSSELPLTSTKNTAFSDLTAEVSSQPSTSSVFRSAIEEKSSISATVRFAYVYVDSSGRNSIAQEDAEVSINEDSSTLLYKTKTYRCMLDRLKYHYRIIAGGSSGQFSEIGITNWDTVIVYMDERDVQLTAPGLELVSESNFGSVASIRKDFERTDVESSCSIPKSLSSLQQHSFKHVKEDHFGASATSSAFEHGFSAETFHFEAAYIFKRHETDNSHFAELQQCFQSFVLRPGQFDIVLCVDHAEVVGGAGYEKANHHKALLIKGLKTNGVLFDQRKLHVGDFLWIAREKQSLSQPKELVLEFIIERKRLDDLASSIIDNRFREQKFRLKRCGLSKIIYLFEDYGATQHLSIPESTLKQAIVNTRVQDGFAIKRTRDTNGTVAYLTLMTRHIQSMYSNTTLVMSTKDHMISKAKKFFIDSAEHEVMSFDEFNKSSMKNNPMTVREIFTRQLMQFHGITADKAIAITQLYPTMTSLISAFEACASAKEKEELLANIKCGAALPMQRRIGPALSKTLYKFFAEKGPFNG